VSGNSSALKTTADINTCDGDSYEQWTESNGTLVEGASGLCLSVTGASTALKATEDLYTCNGSVSENWTVSTSGSTSGTPAFGSNVYVFNTSMSTSTIQNEINNVYNTQQSNQFGTQRYELMFEPGTYNVTVPVGFYTEVVGLGQNPTQTTITGGGVYTDADWNPANNATENFWRDVENITIDPSSGSTEWAASQADPLRRVDIIGNAVLADRTAAGPPAASSATRSSPARSTRRASSSTSPATTSSAAGPVRAGTWCSSATPACRGRASRARRTRRWPDPDRRREALPVHRLLGQLGRVRTLEPDQLAGHPGANGNTPGTSLPISDFYIATPSSTVSQINAALASGQDLLFTPGVYQINGTIDVTNPDTVVLGLGLATLVSNGGNTILSTADVNGIRIGGLLFDAGTTNSASARADRPGRLEREPRVRPDRPVGRLRPHRRRHRRQGHPDARRQQQQRDRRRPVAVASGPRQRRHGRLDHQHRGQRTGRQRRQRHHVRTRGRALPGRPNPMERQRRSRLLLPERNALRPAQPVQLDGRLLRRLSLDQRRELRDQLQGLRTRRVLQLRRQHSVVSTNALTSPNVSGVQWNDMVTISLGGEGTISHVINGRRHGQLEQREGQL
jgi:hypothetical protein